jgi:uncharacterized protein YecA (UPF0149 family)
MKATINVPGHLELVNAEDRDSKDIKGKGWTMQRKYPKVGRNEICPCGSGLKFKNCKHEKNESN